MSASTTISETNIDGATLVHRGKVRDVYQIDEQRLLLVATDRISAFDCVFPTPVPRKGDVLNALSAFWFEKLKGVFRSHLITANFDDFPERLRRNRTLENRSMIVEKTRVFPVECIVRGYLEGSGWTDYKQTGMICGHVLPENLRRCDKLPEPIFTPATKAESGHDENIAETEFADIVGVQKAAELKAASLKIYQAAFDYALGRGIIIADTKFEFGTNEAGDILLIDEALTPDSSRFWSAEKYRPGAPQPSFDKQFVREYLETSSWNKQPPAPALPAEIVEATSERYLSAYKILTGREL